MATDGWNWNLVAYGVLVALVVYYVFLRSQQNGAAMLNANGETAESVVAEAVAAAQDNHLVTPNKCNSLDASGNYVQNPSISVKIDAEPPQHYLHDSDKNFGQILPRDYIIDDEKGQTRIVRFNKDHIYDLDGQVLVENAETVMGFPTTRQLIGHQYAPFDYVEQYSHPCHCYPRKRALDAIGSNHELPRVCNFCKCP